MNIIEAAEAVKAGKRVALGQVEALWGSGYLMWEGCNQNVGVTEHTLSNNWRIIPEPPKLYPFSVALERMKQGKWMKSVASDRVIALYGWGCHQRTFDSGYSKVIEPVFSVPEIEGQWQEVTE